MAKAAILEKPGEPMVIGEIELAEPAPHEVLIDTKACGLCHSDLHFIDGAYPHALPLVPGHEAAGVVRAVGSEVTMVKPGDHVVSCLSAFCGQCEFCVTGRMALCLGQGTRRGKGAAPRLSRGGEPVQQLLNLSAFAEQMLIHEHACVAIDKDMPFDRAAVLGCAVTTGAGTIFNAIKLTPGESVAVIGCGGVGGRAIAQHIDHRSIRGKLQFVGVGRQCVSTCAQTQKNADQEKAQAIQAKPRCHSRIQLTNVDQV